VLDFQQNFVIGVLFVLPFIFRGDKRAG
jgi:hypothetical protein